VGLAVTVLIVLPGHLSTTPRMVKAADSLAHAGYNTRVVSAGFTDWARDADRRLAATRSWAWSCVEHSRHHAPVVHGVTGARRHLARGIARLTGPASAPWWASTRAVTRVFDELVSRGVNADADFVYSGSFGGIPVAHEISRRCDIPFAIDLEDLHTAESVAPDHALHHGLAKRVIERVLPRAVFATTGSECMAERYAAQFGTRPAVLHNVFPLAPQPPRLDGGDAGPLRLYWFSQTVALGRGIEDMVAAAAAARVPTEITVRGRATDVVADAIRTLTARVPNVTLQLQPPADPDRMIELCAGHDVGFASEHEPVENRQVCLTNKVFTYLLAALPVAMSDTLAQRCLAGQLGDAAFVYRDGEIGLLAEWLRGLATDRSRLRRAREAAWQHASRRWHWQHEAEEGQLLSLVSRAIA
jgi:hypothetical protein